MDCLSFRVAVHILRDKQARFYDVVDIKDESAPLALIAKTDRIKKALGIVGVAHSLESSGAFGQFQPDGVISSD
jgi:hypothetical protein